MRYRFALTAALPAAVLLGGQWPAHGVPTAGERPDGPDQCVSESGSSAVTGGSVGFAEPDGSCEVPRPLVCREEEAVEGAVVRNSTADTVTVSGAPGAAGSALECATNLSVMVDTVLTFSYDVPEGTDPCAGGMPRVFVVIDGTSYPSPEVNSGCRDAVDGVVAYPIPVGGTITHIGFGYPRGDTGSITYRDTMIGGSALDI